MYYMLISIQFRAILYLIEVLIQQKFFTTTIVMRICTTDGRLPNGRRKSCNKIIRAVSNLERLNVLYDT